MLLDIRLVFREFSSFILERGKKTNMRMDAREVTGSNFQAFRASFSPPRGKTLYEKTYFSMPESCGYFLPILKYIIVLIQTTVLYTT